MQLHCCFLSLLQVVSYVETWQKSEIILKIFLYFFGIKRVDIPALCILETVALGESINKLDCNTNMGIAFTWYSSLTKESCKWPACS